MEWTQSLKAAVDYMEAHLLEEALDGSRVAKAAHFSPFYFQRGFKLMTGYSIGEYIRLRRLYLAALDMIAGKEKVIDLAYKYGYDTPESFTKAFSRFHGSTPTQLKADAKRIRTFLPLRIQVTVQGGNEMDYTVEKIKGMRLIGFERIFSMETSYREIPKFWEEFAKSCMAPLCAGKTPQSDIERTVCECGIGEYGLCVDDIPGSGDFHYMIAGAYKGGKVPIGMKVRELPEMEWAKFRCTGPLPGALQSVNTAVFKEWLPGNGEYEIAAGLNIEWYAKGDTGAADYESGVWIPVRRRIGAGK